MKAAILTPWSGAGIQSDPNRPLVADAFQLISWKDITGQPCAELPPDPNLYAIEADLTSQALSQVEADPRFYILWSE